MAKNESLSTTSWAPNTVTTIYCSPLTIRSLSVVLAFRFVLRIMGKCASRSGSNRDPDCGMVYGGMKRAWSSLKEFPGTESFVPTFPHRLNRTSRVDSIPGCFSATCRSNLHEHGRTGQARARVERSTHRTFISTRYVLDPTTGFVSCGVKK